MTAVISTCYVLDRSSANITTCFSSENAVNLPEKDSALFPVWFSWPRFTPLINRHFIVNLTPLNATFFEEFAISYTSRSLGIRACVTQRTFCTVWRSEWRQLGNQRSSVARDTVLFDDLVHIKYSKMMSWEGLGIPIISLDALLFLHSVYWN